MAYFNPQTITTLADLKTQYRALAMEHHPDRGGDNEAMQAINNEFDRLFIVWKRRQPKPADTQQAEAEAKETAQTYRSEFYTQNGWKGENYNSKLSLKEIAQFVRDFVKIHYNDFRFSITTSYASMCQELHIKMTEGPVPAYKTPEEWTEEEQSEARRLEWQWKDRSETPEQIENRRATLFLNDYVKDARDAVTDYAKSFNFEDCDGQIDYFHVNFWFFGVEIGRFDKAYKVVPRTRSTPGFTEYETIFVTKYRKYMAIEAQEIPAPDTIEAGQHFKLKGSFSHGHYKGSIYQIAKPTDFLSAYRMDKKLKNMRTGNIRGNNFMTSVDKFKNWVETGTIVFVKLVEVEKSEPYQSAKRVPKYTKDVSTQQASDEERAAHAATGGQGTAPSPYTITQDTDTRDGSALWVLKFTNRLTREEYEAARDALKTIKGYYSKFKKGFIFKHDPTADLAQLYGADAEQATEEPGPEEADEWARQHKAAREVADVLEEKSTEIIKALGIAGGGFEHSTPYRQQMTDYIRQRRDEVTPFVVAHIEIPSLRAVVQNILEELDATPATTEAPAADGYDVPALLAMTKEQYTEWYMHEMARLCPDAQIGLAYSVTDAEHSYTQLHEAAEQAAAS